MNVDQYPIPNNIKEVLESQVGREILIYVEGLCFRGTPKFVREDIVIVQGVNDQDILNIRIDRIFAIDCI